MEDKQQTICQSCGCHLFSQRAGSLTQWIATCNCSSQFRSDQNHLLSTTVSVCTKCGKRISTNDGSLTQWIFGEGRCSCESPTTTEKTIDTFTSLPRENPNASALSVDPGKLPLGRYVPVAELGKGSSGTVYLCNDTMLDKKVAVKTLHQLTDEQLVLFQNEAKATSILNHQHIIKIFDFGATETGSPYMVMEYFSGINLESYLRDYGSMDAETARATFMKIADALAYAHEQSVFHRDLKPSNIVFRLTDGEVDLRLIDFGVAKVKKDTGFLTEFHGKTLVGTPAYMAPDTARDLDYDARSEIYALGCVMYELLSSRQPFSASTAMETMRLHCEEEPASLDELVGREVADQFAPVIAKCLAKEQSDRYQSMKELADALDSIETKLSEPVYTADNLPAVGQNKTMAVLGALVMLLVAMLILYSGINPTYKETSTVDAIDKVHSQGVAYYLSAAEEGDPKAQYKLGICYEDGIGVEENMRQAIIWYKKAADQQYPPALYGLADCYESGDGVDKDLTIAFNLYQKSAELGFAEAQDCLAMCYEDGLGTNKNIKKSFYWYQKAARQGHADAQDSLGDCYYDGRGVDRNLQKAIYWYRKAARKGIPGAQYSLADCYLNGEGLQQNSRQAFRLYKKSAEAGYADAQESLGKCYSKGTGCKKDNKKAFAWFEKAAMQNNKIAQNDLGECYWDGIGVEQDYEKAFAWFQKAAQHGSVDGQVNLAGCFEEGKGTRMDLKAAVSWYLKAAEQNSAEACDELGYCYENGLGVQKNLDKATEFYKKSAQLKRQSDNR